MINLNGIFPPIPTSFDPHKFLALNKLQENLEYLSKYKLAGFLILGSNGENVHLSESEKTDVFDAAREAIPSDKLMLAGTGEQSTRSTIRMTKAAADSGADAALVLNPSYYKNNMNNKSLVNHYTAVADSSPIPVIIYNMPGCSGFDIPAPVIAELSSHPNIIGMKDSGNVIAKMGDLAGLLNPEFQILSGSAGSLLPALSLGAVGGILALSNIAPQQCIDIYDYFENGEIDKARELQMKMIPVNAAITNNCGVPALKAAMDYLGLYGGPPRQPLMPINNYDKAKLIDILDANGIKHFI